MHAAATTNDILDYMVIEGSGTGHIFFQWFTTSLYFHLEHDSVLVMDNAVIHRYGPFLSVLEFLEVGIIFLPPYSPYINPVEHIWVALKAACQRHRRQLRQDPEATLAAILEHYRDFDVIRFESIVTTDLLSIQIITK